MLKEIALLLALAALCNGCGCGCGCGGGGQCSDGKKGGNDFSKINIQANKDGLCKVGLKTHYIPDGAITASSYWRPDVDDFHAPKWARLDQAFIPNVSVGSWSAATNNANQWIEVALGKATTITGVITQGRDSLDQWVTEFKVSYLAADLTWKTVNDNSGTAILFSGNSDRNSPVTNMFYLPITAHKLRILPTKWRGHISLRHEYLTC
uniref:Lactadherin-like n=1 Tax=Phallusia mammillata TaxID=59560 RepID=A0A6F9DLC7_9ASCI|nr:lactadherin-like [Phallusia mammillata]